ncbi:Rad52/Rad22 family DNA repair protein [Anaeromyxobacter sp. SG66]|uniref:Rad52/Rad22 family DNA repair protein n=1 Tax=Anaeromyxobacter sp. SG66 TaxID=2925410 RepID=UPI001F590A0E|nr:Rad52/Rad22 family DNA repair protein [Anaeromyxobacter sp. SG66]
MTHEEKKKLYAALAAPFAEEAVERTDGRVTGKGYSTVGLKYQFVVNRMNEVLGLGGWRVHRTIRTKEITTAKGRPAYESVAEVTIELGEWIDGNFVAWADAVADGGHVSMSEPDSIKGSYTNAVKKCCAFFGVGRQAYEGTLDDDNVPQDGDVAPVTHVAPPSSAPVAQRPASPPPPPVVQTLPTRPSAPPRNRLTSKQLAAIWAIARKLGFEQQALRQMVKSKFNAQPEFLTRDQASALIGSLAQEAGNGHADEMRQPGEEG